MDLPIKPGTARRLGIRPPIHPVQWLVGMQRHVNFMVWQLDMIDLAYGRPAGSWRQSSSDTLYLTPR
jgi:hypothetical protein